MESLSIRSPSSRDRRQYSAVGSGRFSICSLLSVDCPQALSRLSMGADHFQQQRLSCLLAKEIPGDGDRRGGCLLGARHKQTSSYFELHPVWLTRGILLNYLYKRLNFCSLDFLWSINNLRHSAQIINHLTDHIHVNISLH